MNAHYRHSNLLNLLNKQGTLSTQQIIEALNISPATARRDINLLHQAGKLRKVRNGAEALYFDVNQPRQRTFSNSNEKQRIAKAASELCQEGESILITCGSTMLMLGEQLCGRKLQIITNYLPLANHLIERNHDDIVILGGQYNRNKAITLSLNTQNETTYIANIMFTSGRGFTKEGLYKTDMIIANSEQQMSAKSGKYVVLLDSSKLGQQVGMLFTKLEEIDILITGKEADPNIIAELQQQGLEVILA
ncbi:HTH-type transcriptional regulator UlaR [Volucribacter amazonae]|uniref:Transcriptional regulator n=1 Tax=Volucribacter amazonae TaxID=256731 RepID=A0A9X4P9J7_9PAST|nr:HTH-type transcriptional regulator UlaR [Volucribacter amazonae]MDG6895008.1 transcriptional regulator [Volucribacter amazonae]